MTIEELEQFIANVDADGLAAAVTGMPESERKALSTATAKLKRELEKARWRWDDEKGTSYSLRLDRLDRWLKTEALPEVYDQLSIAEMASLAFCPFSTVRKTDGRYIRIDGNRAMVAILTDRRPEWIDDWVEARLEDEWQGIDWGPLRTMIKTGLCRKPASPGYIQLMTDRLPDSWSFTGEDREYMPLSRKLLADPELLDDEVWRLFEVDTYAFGGWESPETPKGYESWSAAIRRLSEEGHLDRNRLLDSSLSGLTMGFNKRALTDYISFHNYLEPAVDEIVARQQTYLDLISSQSSHVVTFALKMLKVIDKAKAMDDAVFLASASCLMSMQTKTQPKTGLVLMKRILKRNGGLASLAARTAAGGLTHPSADIQEAAMDVIDLASVEGDRELLEAIADSIDDIAATHRTRAEQLLTKLGGGEQLNEPPATNIAVDKTELLKRCDALDEDVRRIAGVDDAIAALAGQTPPARLAFAISDAPILASSDRIQPIESFDELLDTVSHAVEVVDSADEVERILDAISRLCDQQPANMNQLAGPLVKRINREDMSGAARGLVHSTNDSWRLKDLLLTWLTGQAVRSLGKAYKQLIGPARFLNARVHELADRVRRRQAAALLAAPTHTGGWIDPTVLCQRMIDLQASGMEIPPFDFIQALLRMAPDRREEAAELAGDISGHEGKAIRWALGGGEQLEQHDSEHPLLWLAAGRARDPHGVLDVLAEFDLNDLGADAVAPATYTWKASVTKKKSRYRAGTYRYPELRVTSNPKGPTGLAMSAFPTSALHVRGSKWGVYGVSCEWLFSWIAMSWPMNCDAFFATGAVAIAFRIDDPSSTFNPNFAFLSPLFEPDRPLTEMGTLALCTALVSRDADARAQAVDVLTESLQDGRAHHIQIADVLTKLSSDAWMKLNRLADTMGEISRLSAMHAHVSAFILQHWLAARRELPRDTHYILTLLLDLLARLGLPLADETRGVLEGLKGSSKTAKLASRILNVKPEAPTQMHAEAMLQHLDSRLSRAERWMRTNNL